MTNVAALRRQLPLRWCGRPVLDALTAPLRTAVINCATSNRRRIVSARVPGRVPGFSAETVLAGSGAL